jgi:hypothetical protein
MCADGEEKSLVYKSSVSEDEARGSAQETTRRLAILDRLF